MTVRRCAYQEETRRGRKGGRKVCTKKIGNSPLPWELAWELGFCMRGREAARAAVGAAHIDGGGHPRRSVKKIVALDQARQCRQRDRNAQDRRAGQGRAARGAAASAKRIVLKWNLQWKLQSPIKTLYATENEQQTWKQNGLRHNASFYVNLTLTMSAKLKEFNF